METELEISELGLKIKGKHFTRNEEETFEFNKIDQKFEKERFYKVLINDSAQLKHEVSPDKRIAILCTECDYSDKLCFRLYHGIKCTKNTLT